MVYLLCFESKLKHAKHYIGFVEKPDGLEPRMKKHRNGSGSKLMSAVSKAGIQFAIARLWQNGDRNFERWLKNKKNAKYLCPCCNARVKPINQRLVFDTETSGLDPLNSSTPIISSTVEILGDSVALPSSLTDGTLQIELKP